MIGFVAPWGSPVEPTSLSRLSVSQFCNPIELDDRKHPSMYQIRPTHRCSLIEARNLVIAGHWTATPNSHVHRRLRYILRAFMGATNRTAQKRRSRGGRGGRGGGCLSASVAEPQRKGPAARKLNPLETIIKVYTEASRRTDARPDRQYPFFTGLPLKPYFDR